MERKDSNKQRRPLPTPATGAPSQRPNTPVAAAALDPISTAAFYGQTSSSTSSTSAAAAAAPPLPSRPKGHGSSRSIHHEEPPNYRHPEELIEIQPAEYGPRDQWGTSGTTHDSWGYRPPASWDDDPSYSGVPSLLNDIDMGVGVPIDGRSLEEEKDWWNPVEREHHERPGPGLLPSVLVEEVHNTDHALFSVSASPPIVSAPPPLAPAGTYKTQHHHHASTSSTSESILPASGSSPSSSVISLHGPPPSEDDVRLAVPHPNAYYCPKDNAWIILSWKSSTVNPPIANSFNNTSHHPLPDQSRRKRSVSCLEDTTGGIRLNKTHHFHKYAKAIDAHKLTPPLRRDEWEVAETVKQKRRGGAVIMDDQDLERIRLGGGGGDDLEETETEEGKLLDLYICCQCQFYVVASGLICGVIPRKYLDEFAKERRESPPVGKTPEQMVSMGIETIMTAIENRLWKNEARSVRVTRPQFQMKVGWTTTSKKMFESLGFIEEGAEEDTGIKPPVADLSPLGRINRKKLLRAWVELGAWLADYRRINVKAFNDPTRVPKPLSTKIDPAREMLQSAVGAHPDQMPRAELTQTFMIALEPFYKAWQAFGLTQSTYSPELLAFAYYAQCRCDPTGVVRYFTHLSSIVRTLQHIGQCPPPLQDTLAMESSRNRFTEDDVLQAATTLGFGAESPLRVEFDEDIPEEFIENAWKTVVRESWRDDVRGAQRQRDANDALRVLAEARGLPRLRKAYEAARDAFMNPARAYNTLEVPNDVDENMLLMIYAMRLEEQPSQADRMREALAVIAEVRDSDRLKLFLESGQDPNDFVPATRPDLPRGLNQLGNTCYLNSLLQYFYTIKDLREAVLPLTKADLKELEDEQLTDDDIKQHRVGGRLVTRREILRSRKFVNQLAELFFNMEYCEQPSVTPTIELAKLALVTSRDEEEDEAESRATDSSNDTDVTLVEGPISESPSRTSILGKRAREGQSHGGGSGGGNGSGVGGRESPDSLRRPLSPLSFDTGAVIPTSGPGSGSSSRAPAPSQPSSSNPEVAGPEQGPGPGARPRSDQEIEKKRPVPVKKPTKVSESAMLFGKQHDVAECMDNCMFQIETALLPLLGGGSAQDGSKMSVVKRLFYGKIKQRLSRVEASVNAPMHIKEDLFSHLPVNVADDGIDVYDGLGGYFDDVVSFEGKDHRMEVSLVDLPPLLQIQLQRVQFNRETLQPYKSQAYVRFGETLFMDRFMDNADPKKKAESKVKHRELSQCRERLRSLVQGREGSSYLSALEQTHLFLSRVECVDVPELDDELLAQLDGEQLIIREEIDVLRARIDRLKEELEAIWRDARVVEYELTSVFIHRGSSPSWGHYFFYSRNLPAKPDEWFKYNDSDVSVVDKAEVLADTTGSTANPYLLVFARKGSDVVDTVKRFDPTQIMDSS